MLRLLSIHEAVPGHYLQGVYANRSSSLPRSIFQSGLFAEGWAVYVTQDDRRRLRRRRSGAAAQPLEVLPALGHQRDHRRWIHCHGMTEDEAVGSWSMAGSRRRPGPGKRRACPRPSCDRLTRVDGDVGHRARGHAGAAIVPQAPMPESVRGALPGGFGETPGFRYRQHLESVIAHGALHRSPRCAGSPRRRLAEEP